MLMAGKKKQSSQRVSPENVSDVIFNRRLMSERTVWEGKKKSLQPVVSKEQEVKAASGA